MKSTQYTVHSTKEASKSSLRNAIIADIQTNNIRPRSKWYYIMLHTFLGLSGIVTIFLGSFACSFVILELSLPGRAYARLIEMPHPGLIDALPYLWGIGMIFALTLGYFIFSKTGRSYRYHAGLIASVLIIGSLIGGGLLFATGIAGHGDRMMQRFEPRYGEFRTGMYRLPRPQDGTLPLLISEISGTSFSGKTPDGKSWNAHLTCQDDNCRQATTRIRIGRPALFQGTVSGEAIFMAHDVHTGRPNRR